MCQKQVISHQTLKTVDPTLTIKYRSSRSQIFFKIGVLKNFAKFTEKDLCQSLFLIKRLRRKCFPVNFAKFLRTFF